MSSSPWPPRARHRGAGAWESFRPGTGIEGCRPGSAPREKDPGFDSWIHIMGLLLAAQGEQFTLQSSPKEKVQPRMPMNAKRRRMASRPANPGFALCSILAWVLTSNIAGNYQNCLSLGED